MPALLLSLFATVSATRLPAPSTLRAPVVARGAARLSMAEDARSLVAYSNGYAVLSTLSSAVEGYPNGALVGFAPDASGLPVFVFSAMSSHTKDLLADGA